MGKYRQPNEATNSDCALCSTPIWVRTGVYTDYHGNTHEHNTIGGPPESISHWHLGALCVTCFKENSEETNRIPQNSESASKERG